VDAAAEVDAGAQDCNAWAICGLGGRSLRARGEQTLNTVVVRFSAMPPHRAVAALLGALITSGATAAAAQSDASTLLLTRTVDRTELYTADDDGKSSRRLGDVGRIPTSPGWSPDGSRIGFHLTPRPMSPWSSSPATRSLNCWNTPALASSSIVARACSSVCLCS
jgi:hypothetical protein